MQPLYVQIKCELGRAYEVADAIVDTLAETSEVYTTSGEYDLLAKFYIAEGESPGKFVNDRLHRVPGLRETHTIVAFRLFGAGGGPKLDEG
jgi:DNA-binding Lrp family transcriptional regulator